MCIKTGCKTTGCIGCGWYCYCNYTCYKCYFNSITKNRSCFRNFDWNPYENVRNKYVCFPCKRIWKSSVSKYQYCPFIHDGVNEYKQNPESNHEYDHLKFLYTRKSTVPMEKRKKTKPEYEDSQYYQFCGAYKNKHSKCAKCSRDGLYVGQNFRHCKTEKEWKKLELAVEKKEIDLVNDFTDYPKYINGQYHTESFN